MAGFNFFTALAGLGVAGLFSDPSKALAAAGLSAAIGFFAVLGIKRGIIRPTNKA